VAGAFLWAAGAQERGAVVDPVPATVTVGERERDYLQEVAVTFGLSSPTPVVSARSGLVTAVSVQTSSRLQEAMDVLSIDGVSVRAHRGELPFYRSLARGDRGADVRELARYLTQAGFPCAVADGDMLGDDVAAAVRGYQKSVGAAANGVFDPGLVVFVPAGGSRVGDVNVSVGSRVETGGVLLTGESRPTSMRIEPAEESGRIEAADHDGPFLLTRGESRVTLQSLDPGREETDRAFEALGAARDPAGEPSGVDGGSGVDAAGPQVQVTGVQIAVARPVTVGTVPTGSLYAGRDGSLCIFVIPGASGVRDVADARPVVVDDPAPVAGEISVVSVDEDLAGETVVSRPFSLPVEQRAACE